MNSPAEDLYNDESYVRRFALPFLDARIHFGVRDLGSQFHLEGFAELPDGEQEEFDVIFTVDTHTGDFTPAGCFIEYLDQRGVGAFAKAHGGSTALLGGCFKALGGMFNWFLKALLWSTAIGAFSRGPAGLAIMLMPWAFAAVMIATFGGVIAIGLGGLIALWATLGVMRLASARQAKKRLGAAIDDLTADIGLKIVDLLHLPNSDNAKTIAGELGGRADGGRDCVLINRAEHAVDLLVAVEIKDSAGGRGTLATVECLSTVMPRSPGKALQEQVTAEITRCLKTYPAQLAPPALPKGGTRLQALVFLEKPDGSFFELGTHLVRQGLALPRPAAEITRACSVTNGTTGMLESETLNALAEAKAEAQNVGRGIWNGIGSGSEETNDGSFMPQDAFEKIMKDIDARDSAA